METGGEIHETRDQRNLWLTEEENVELEHLSHSDSYVDLAKHSRLLFLAKLRENKGKERTPEERQMIEAQKNLFGIDDSHIEHFWSAKEN